MCLQGWTGWVRLVCALYWCEIAILALEFLEYVYYINVYGKIGFSYWMFFVDRIIYMNRYDFNIFWACGF